MDTETWTQITDNLRQRKVHLQLPRFEVEYDRKLNDDLKSLGMGIAFDEKQADFSRICSSNEILYINDVLHKTFVKVDEEGTEAAAVTKVEVYCPTTAPTVVEMRVDHPFVFNLLPATAGAVAGNKKLKF